MEPSEETKLKESEPIPATVRWQHFQDAIKASALRTADERAKREREKTDATEYHRRALASQGG